MGNCQSDTTIDVPSNGIALSRVIFVCALDPEVIDEATRVIRKHVANHDLTMLMVAHQMGFAPDISGRISVPTDNGIPD